MDLGNKVIVHDEGRNVTPSFELAATAAHYSVSVGAVGKGKADEAGKRNDSVVYDLVAALDAYTVLMFLVSIATMRAILSRWLKGRAGIK
jgi:hypothetical protein